MPDTLCRNGRPTPEMPMAMMQRTLDIQREAPLILGRMDQFDGRVGRRLEIGDA